MLNVDLGNGKSLKSDLLNTHLNSPDVLLREAMPHGSNHRIDLCSCLFDTEGYVVANAITLLLIHSAQMLYHSKALVSA